MLPQMIHVRKLVAVELTFLGPMFILAEYTVAVIVALVVALLSLRVGLSRTYAPWQILLGLYLLSLSLSYGVLLASAMAMLRRGNACDEIAGELDDTRLTFRKYRRQSLWILVPFAVPMAAILQRRHPSDKRAG